jgi:hypothetical protein
MHYFYPCQSDVCMPTFVFKMKISFYILIGLIGLSFLTQKESHTTIRGDFDGDGEQESASIVTETPGQKGDGENEMYMADLRKVGFSRKKFPSIAIGNASALYNIGDINLNQTDEILISGWHDPSDPFYHGYAVYTFDPSKQAWLKVLDANVPSASRGYPEQWVYQKNDTLFYWNSLLTNELLKRDTLCWIHK